jgi:hypothetical protein
MKRRGRGGSSTLIPLPSLEPPPEIRLANRTAMRAEWIDPEDDKPSAARVGRTIHGHRTFCPLRSCLHRHGSRSSFTADHVEAADRLRACWDGARLGYAGLRDWAPVQSAMYRPATGHKQTALKQLRARKMFDAAWSLFRTEERALLALVVLANVTVTQAADRLELRLPLAKQRLIEALDRLAEHFDVRDEALAA